MKRRFKRISKKIGKYKSQLESHVAKVLGKRAKYESETISYVLPKRYIPDFVITKQDGQKIYIEVKGWFRFEDQQKMKAVRFSNPSLDIRMYFPNDGKVQGSKMKNSQWCQKYSFSYSIGKIPVKEWMT